MDSGKLGCRWSASSGDLHQLPCLCSRIFLHRAPKRGAVSKCSVSYPGNRYRIQSAVAECPSCGRVQPCRYPREKLRE